MVERATKTAEDLPAAEPPRRDGGMSFIELLVAIVLLGTVVVGVLTAMRATIIGTRLERDHSKAQQWLQSGVGVIEGYNFAKCSTLTLNGSNVQAAYQAAIDNPTTGAQQPYGFSGATITVLLPEVWDGSKWEPFASQSQCLDEFLLRQQLVTIVVRGPQGDIIETVEMVKRDKK